MLLLSNLSSNPASNLNHLRWDLAITIRRMALSNLRLLEEWYLCTFQMHNKAGMSCP